MVTDLDFTEFRGRLLTWYEGARRDLPWRRTRDPYRILISEVMLQQTRVATAIPYYERFLERFPTVESLAEAADDDLLAQWSGLGYYYRARNLREAARQVVAAGGFQPSYDFLLSLRGIGGYTAAAMASICFGLPYAVVDGNVLRVVARLWNDPMDIASQTTKRVFQTRADAMLDPKRPADFNQAVMELGATVCLPRHPQCLLCPVGSFCQASAAGTQDRLPVKKKSDRVEIRRHELAIVLRDGRLLLKRRGAEESLMPGFLELPEQKELPGGRVVQDLGEVKHTITHHKLTYGIGRSEWSGELAGAEWCELAELDRVPLTTVTKKALQLLGAM